jgi:hypothetical protein
VLKVLLENKTDDKNNLDASNLRFTCDFYIKPIEEKHDFDA